MKENFNSIGEPKANLVLPRKDKYKFEDPDKTQRPPTPVLYDNDHMKIPKQITVPAYYPDYSSMNYNKV